MEFPRLRLIPSGVGAGRSNDVAGKQTTGKETKGHFDFKTKAGEEILIRVGASQPSAWKAHGTILHAEIPDWNFDAVAAAARKQW